MKELIKKNYIVTVKRGLIDNGTQAKEFILKLYEEVAEFQRAIEKGEGSYESEIADVILVAFNYCVHMGLDIEKTLKNRIQENDKRSKN